MVPVSAQDIFREATGFSPEDQTVVSFERPVCIELIAFCREVNETRVGQGRVKSLEVSVPLENDLGPVVKSGPADRSSIHAESRHTHDMKRNPGSRTKPRDIAGVRWYFWFYKRNIHHFAGTNLLAVVHHPQ